MCTEIDLPLKGDSIGGGEEQLSVLFRWGNATFPEKIPCKSKINWLEKMALHELLLKFKCKKSTVYRIPLISGTKEDWTVYDRNYCYTQKIAYTTQ